MEIQIKDLEKLKKLDEIIAKYKADTSMLIRILSEAQELFGYLPPSVQSYIAEELNLPISTINGVVSFYSLFSQEPKGKYIIGVCMGTACYVRGAQEVLDAIKDKLHIDVGETTLDGLFTIQSTRCIGACGLAPVILINKDVHGRLAPTDIPGILHNYTKKSRELVTSGMDRKL